MPPATRRSPAARPAAVPDPEVAPAPVASTDAVPLFGHREDWGATREFDLEVFVPSDNETYVQRFTCMVDPGAGPVLAYMRASRSAREDPGQLAAAGGQIIYRALIDHDGLSVAYEPPRSADGKVLEDDPAYDPRFADRDAWSSRRLFSEIVEDEDLQVDGEVIAELGAWIAKTAPGRPTGTPRASSPGRKQTRRGSARGR